MTSFPDRAIKDFISGCADWDEAALERTARLVARDHRRLMRAHDRTPAWKRRKKQRRGMRSGYKGRDALIFQAVAEQLRRHGRARVKDLPFKLVREAFSEAEGRVRD